MPFHTVRGYLGIDWNEVLRRTSIKQQRHVSRYALLIASPSDDIPGVEKDIWDFKEYLLSREGGLWSDDEIHVRISPNLDEVLNHTRLMQLSEYSLTVFSGHGCIQANDTIFDLGEDTIESNLLRVGADRHCLIFDCCRVRQTVLMESLAALAKQVQRELNPDMCRKLFDYCIAAGPKKGLTVLSACTEEEVTHADPDKGSDYLQALLSCGYRRANRWRARAEDDDGLSVIEAHEQAERIVVRQTGGRQNPDILQMVKSDEQLPFCVTI